MSRVIIMKACRIIGGCSRGSKVQRSFLEMWFRGLSMFWGREAKSPFGGWSIVVTPFLLLNGRSPIAEEYDLYIV